MAKWITSVEWDEVPHLDADSKRDLYNAYLPHEREARRKGIPTVGSGKIYPVEEAEFVINPIEIPPNWPRVYAVDPGWRFTAGVWAAYDEREDCVYIYGDYKVENKTPTEISAFLYRNAKGYIPGVIDPAAKGLKMRKDGISFLREYQDMGLDLYLANNAVESGIFNVLNRLTTGRLKVFSTCQQWINEFRIYRRTGNGNVYKHNDDLMDATRYLVMTGLQHAITRPDDDDDDRTDVRRMMKNRGKNPITGY
jgi:hypothetical protein